MRAFASWQRIRGLLVAVVASASCQTEAPKSPPPSTTTAASVEAPSAQPQALSPAPEPSTAPTTEPLPPRLPHQQADIDPDNDLIVAPPDPLADCTARLEAAGVEFRLSELPLKQKRGQLFTCGAEQVVTYLGGPAAIRYNSAPTMTCRMALALAHFEEMAEEEAAKELGSPIIRFTHIGTYSCRKMARFDWVSEHSYANAIDIQAMTLKNGKRITIEKSFGALDAEPKTPEARFLRKLANRAFDEEVFSVVLTPYWDKLHRDHLHLDLARYRVDGSRPSVN